MKKILLRPHTSQNSFNKQTKISSLEIIIFGLENDGKKWSRIYFEICQAPSEIPAKGAFTNYVYKRRGVDSQKN